MVASPTFSDPTLPMRQAPIALFDSGVGGLTVLESLMRVLPHEQYVYVADTEWFPYGPKSQEELTARIQQLLGGMEDAFHPKLLVVACNTASSLLQQTPYPLVINTPLINTIDPTTLWLASQAISRIKKVGIIATERTIALNGYGLALKRYQTLLTNDASGPSLHLLQTPVSPLASLIESGQGQSEACRQVLAETLTPMAEWGMDALIFGCTHYPHVYHLVDELLPKHIGLIDPAHHTANAAIHYLSVERLFAPVAPEADPTRCQYFTTHPSPEFEATARRLPLHLAMPTQTEVLAQ